MVRLLVVLAMYLGLQVELLALNPQRYDAEIKQCEATVSGWNVKADIQIALTILVAVFGASITVLQAMTKGWAKTTTIVLGGCTTIFTGVNAAAFSSDYRMLEEASVDATDLIGKLNVLRESISPTMTPSQRDEVEVKWTAVLGQFHALEKVVIRGGRDAVGGPTMKGASDTHSNSIFSTQTVHAQSASNLPEWARTPPMNDNYFLYFTGAAEDASIATAEKRSYDDAINKAVTQLSASGKDPDALRRAMPTLSSVDKTYFSFDKGKGLYQFHSLIRISKEVQDFSFSKTVSAPPTLQLSEITVKHRGPGNAGWHFKVYVDDTKVMEFDIENGQFANSPVRPALTGGSFASLDLGNRKKFVIRVKGRRIGAPLVTAEGDVHFKEGDSRFQEQTDHTIRIPVSVKNTLSAIGEFEFIFSRS